MGLRDELLRLLPEHQVNALLPKQGLGLPSPLDTGSPYRVPSSFPQDAGLPESALPGIVARGLSLPEAATRPTSQGIPYDSFTLNLASDISTTKSFLYKQGGTALYYRQYGSIFGGVVDVKCGGTIQQLFPGCRLEGDFQNFEIVLNASSIAFGNAVFIVEKQAGRHFVETVQPPKLDLLASSSPAGNNSTTNATGVLDVSPYDLIAIKFKTVSSSNGGSLIARWAEFSDDGTSTLAQLASSAIAVDASTELLIGLSLPAVTNPVYSFGNNSIDIFNVKPILGRVEVNGASSGVWTSSLNVYGVRR